MIVRDPLRLSSFETIIQSMNHTDEGQEISKIVTEDEDTTMDGHNDALCRTRMKDSWVYRN